MSSAPNKSGEIGQKAAVIQEGPADPDLFPLRREPLARSGMSSTIALPAALIASAPNRSGGIGHVADVTLGCVADPYLIPLRREPLAMMGILSTGRVPAALIESASYGSGGIGRYRDVNLLRLADPNSFPLRREPLATINMPPIMQVPAATHTRAGSSLPPRKIVRASSIPAQQGPLASAWLPTIPRVPAANLSALKSGGIGRVPADILSRDADPNLIPRKWVLLVPSRLPAIYLMPAATLSTRHAVSGSQPRLYKRDARARRRLMSPALITSGQQQPVTLADRAARGLAMIDVSNRTPMPTPTLSRCIRVRAANNILSSIWTVPLATYPASPEGQGLHKVVTQGLPALT